MKELMKLRPFLRFGTDIDSDVAKANFTPPARSPSLPKSSLKPRSKSRPASKPPSRPSSRAPSRGPSRPQTPKRTAKSPERQDEADAQPKRKRTLGAVSSAYFSGFTPSDVQPSPVYRFDEMPRDLYAVGWKKAFLEWTVRDLYTSWDKGARAFVNMHTALYMCEPTAKYPIAHPRAFAACSLSLIASICQSLSYLVVLPLLHLYFFLVYLVTCSLLHMPHAHCITPLLCFYFHTCSLPLFWWAWLCVPSAQAGWGRCSPEISRGLLWKSKRGSPARALHDQNFRPLPLPLSTLGSGESLGSEGGVGICRFSPDVPAPNSSLLYPSYYSLTFLCTVYF